MPWIQPEVFQIPVPAQFYCFRKVTDDLLIPASLEHSDHEYPGPKGLPVYLVSQGHVQYLLKRWIFLLHPFLRERELHDWRQFVHAPADFFSGSDCIGVT